MSTPDIAGLGPSLVVHTSVPFGLEHLERDKEEVQPIILEELYKLLPDLPQPTSIKCQKWRYSQVSPMSALVFSGPRERLIYPLAPPCRF